MTKLQRIAVAPDQVSGQTLQLTPEQQHYLNRVLRLKVGDRFITIRELGWWLAELESSETACLLEPIARQTDLPVAVTLIMALPKTGMDDLVRQVTELGVAQIAPVISDRTLLYPSPQKLDRWRRIAQEAAEQSERQSIPVILDPVPFADSLRAHSQKSQGYICLARGNPPSLLTHLQQQSLASLTSLSIAIGCEGGWTTGEIEQAIAAGLIPVSLGRRVLRSVTAPITALSIVAAVFEALDDTHPSSETLS